jgi:hypothetical protein
MSATTAEVITTDNELLMGIPSMTTPIDYTIRRTG